MFFHPFSDHRYTVVGGGEKNFFLANTSEESKRVRWVLKRIKKRSMRFVAVY
jgi:hypothetical protein